MGGEPCWIASSTRSCRLRSSRRWSVTACSGGSPADIADGFIHLSRGSQVAGTLDKHFNGVAGLMLAAVDLSGLGDTVRWVAFTWRPAVPAHLRPLARRSRGLLRCGGAQRGRHGQITRIEAGATLTSSRHDAPGHPACPVMRVADRHGERVGRIRAADHGTRQQPAHHHLHLLLLRAAGTRQPHSFTDLAAYSVTGTPASAGASSAMPRA